MCTVTVLRFADRFIVTMNRDESRDRGEEIAPVYDQHDNWSGPMDGISGGTWFGLSHQGLVGCLMNGYDFEVRKELPQNLTSRGKLIPAVFQFQNISSINSWVENQDFSNFASFRLLIMDHEQSVEWTWNGSDFKSITSKSNREIYSSSSWQQEHTISFRQRKFEVFLNELNLTNLSVEDYVARDFHHLCSDAQAGPLIQRKASVTKSISQAIISSEKDSVLRYWAKPESEKIEEPKQITIPNYFHPSVKD